MDLYELQMDQKSRFNGNKRMKQRKEKILKPEDSQQPSASLLTKLIATSWQLSSKAPMSHATSADFPA
ncbi:hypothetical protein Peur_073842 [Populus x canadensis]